MSSLYLKILLTSFCLIISSSAIASPKCASVTDKTVAFYEAQGATAYNDRTKDAEMDFYYQRFLELISKQGIHSAEILDVGAGPGRDAKYFQSLGHKVLAYDASKSMVDFARKQNGVEAMQLRFDEVQFVESFDAIWAMSSLLHAGKEQLPQILKDHRDALRPGGIFFLSILNNTDNSETESFSEDGPEYSRGRRWLKFSVEELTALVEAVGGFEIIEISDKQDTLKAKGKRDVPGFWTHAYLRKISIRH